MASGSCLAGFDCLPHLTAHIMDDEPLVPWREISALSLDRAEALEAERDELRAQVENLMQAIANWGQRVLPGVGVEEHLLARIQELRAEVERRADHHAHYHQICSMGGNTPCSHEAAVERLRAALDPARAAEVAMLFHDTYERLAPTFGYETREETRQFDPTSPNGALMIAVAGSVLRELCQT